VTVFPKITEDLLTELGIELGEEGNLTLDDLEKLTQIFASQRTCEEREKTWKMSVDGLNATVANLDEHIKKQSAIVQQVHDGNLLLDVRVAAIETQQGIRRKSFYDRLKASIAVIALAVSMITLVVLIIEKLPNG
jgi:hypothetical protein